MEHFLEYFTTPGVYVRIVMLLCFYWFGLQHGKKLRK